MVHPGSHRIARVLWYSGTFYVTFNLIYGTVTLYGKFFQTASTIYSWIALWKPYNPENPKIFGLASIPFARRYLEYLIWFLFLRVLRCFTSPSSLLHTYFIQYEVTEVYSARFPHSEIPGSKFASQLPETYRRHATSFIASLRQGIPRTPLVA